MSAWRDVPVTALAASVAAFAALTLGWRGAAGLRELIGFSVLGPGAATEGPFVLGGIAVVVVAMALVGMLVGWAFGRIAPHATIAARLWTTALAVAAGHLLVFVLISNIRMGMM